MKKYKLVKDLPTFNAGDVFYLNEAGSLIHEGDGVAAYSWATIDKFPNILTDWFEEVNESTRWKPEMDQKYYCFGSNGFVYSDTWANGSAVDNGRFEIGNCFQTEEEAERVAEYLKALAVVRGYATGKFVRGTSNWYVYYDVHCKRLGVSSDYYCNKNGIFGLPYFATEEDAERSIEQHRNEWLTIFDVKERNEAQK